MRKNFCVAFVVLFFGFFAPALAQVRVSQEPEGFILATPAQANGQVFVLYPGGLVPATAYQFIAETLAQHGITVAIPYMPFDLAFLGIYRAQEVRQALVRRGVQIKKFVIGGHSLGAAMAGWYAAWLPVDGLVLLGGYSALEVKKDIPTLVLAAEFDGLATVERVKTEMWKLPAEANFVVLLGGVHAYFGRYGEQRGDGKPTVAREIFESQLLENMLAFFELPALLGR